jgi:hypothetical protein
MIGERVASSIEWSDRESGGLLKKSRKDSAISIGEVRETPFGFLITGAMGIQLFPWPLMALIKGHTWLLLDWGLRLLMKVDQAAFLAEIISRFLIASAFFQANLFSDESGDLRQAFSALLADATAA